MHLDVNITFLQPFCNRKILESANMLSTQNQPTMFWLLLKCFGLNCMWCIHEQYCKCGNTLEWAMVEHWQIRMGQKYWSNSIVRNFFMHTRVFVFESIFEHNENSELELFSLNLCAEKHKLCSNDTLWIITYATCFH